MTKRNKNGIRYIQHRGKCVEHDLWRYGFLFIDSEEKTFIIHPEVGYKQEVRPETVVQSTGLADVNNDEILRGML